MSMITFCRVTSPSSQSQRGITKPCCCALIFQHSRTLSPEIPSLRNNLSDLRRYRSHTKSQRITCAPFSRSMECRVFWFQSGPDAPTCLPHEVQNLLPGARLELHPGHRPQVVLPQVLQKLAPGLILAPQPEHGGTPAWVSRHRSCDRGRLHTSY